MLTCYQLPSCEPCYHLTPCEPVYQLPPCELCYQLPPCEPCYQLPPHDLSSMFPASSRFHLTSCLVISLSRLASCSSISRITSRRFCYLSSSHCLHIIRIRFSSPNLTEFSQTCLYLGYDFHLKILAWPWCSKALSYLKN